MDVTDIPLDDIKLFLIENSKKFSNSNNAYDDAWKLMQNKNSIFKPTSIIKWMMAYNLIQNNIQIPIYNKNKILALSSDELKKLTKLLTMKNVNIDNMIDILRYLHKYDEALDFDKNRDLYKPLILNSDINTIITLMKANEGVYNLDNLVLELLPEIFEKNKNDDLLEFIYKFLEIKKINIVKKIFGFFDPSEILSDFGIGLSFGLYIDLGRYIFSKELINQEVIEAYLKLNPNKTDWDFLVQFIIFIFLGNNIINVIESMTAIMRFAIKTNTLEIIDMIKNLTSKNSFEIWDNIRHYNLLYLEVTEEESIAIKNFNYEFDKYLR